jgi:F0F1-type ATP synthase membrane subunit b/b'
MISQSDRASTEGDDRREGRDGGQRADPRASIAALEASIRQRTEQAAHTQEVLDRARDQAERLTADALAQADRDAERRAGEIAVTAATQAQQILDQARRDVAQLREAAAGRREVDVQALLVATLPVPPSAGPGPAGG